MLARNLKKFKLITFDCTNTLLYFKVPPSQIYLNTAIELGHKKENFDPKIDMYESFKKNFKSLKKEHPNFGSDSIGYEQWWTKLVTQVLSETSSNKIVNSECEKVAKHLIKKYETEECWGKFEKTDELIQAIRRENKILGVISNFDPRLHNLLDRMELDFNFVTTSYEAKIEKPKVEIFHHAIKLASEMIYPPNLLDIVEGITPSEALHIGNELENDSEGAKRAGWSSVLIAENGDFKTLKDFYLTLNNEMIDL